MMFAFASRSPVVGLLLSRFQERKRRRNVIREDGHFDLLGLRALLFLVRDRDRCFFISFFLFYYVFPFYIRIGTGYEDRFFFFLFFLARRRFFRPAELERYICRYEDCNDKDKDVDNARCNCSERGAERAEDKAEPSAFPGRGELNESQE